MHNDEILGRLAALELALGRTLYYAARETFASSWPTHIEAERDRTMAELPAELSGHALSAAQDSLRRIFERSRSEHRDSR